MEFPYSAHPCRKRIEEKKNYYKLDTVAYERATLREEITLLYAETFLTGRV